MMTCTYRLIDDDEMSIDMGLETQSSLGIPIGVKSKQDINSNNGHVSKYIKNHKAF